MFDDLGNKIIAALVFAVIVLALWHWFKDTKIGRVITKMGHYLWKALSGVLSVFETVA